MRSSANTAKHSQTQHTKVVHVLLRPAAAAAPATAVTLHLPRPALLLYLATLTISSFAAG